MTHAVAEAAPKHGRPAIIWTVTTLVVAVGAWALLSSVTAFDRIVPNLYTPGPASLIVSSTQLQQDVTSGHAQRQLQRIQNAYEHVPLLLRAVAKPRSRVTEYTTFEGRRADTLHYTCHPIQLVPA